MSEYSMLAWGMPGGWEWIVILIVVLVIFGNRLPALARGLGKSISEFKKGTKEGSEEDNKDKPLSHDDIKK